MPEITNNSLLPAYVTPEKLKEDYLEYGSLEILAKYYGVSPREILLTMARYNMSLRGLNSERIHNRLKKDYEEIVTKLGHHPTILEMKKRVKSKRLYHNIVRHFGTLNKFKKAYGYPIPENPHTLRAMALYKDYLNFGTLAKVAKKHNISGIRVGQILRGGNAKGLFKYPTPKAGISQ